jgi:uncharacterized membrane protein YgcG
MGLRTLLVLAALPALTPSLLSAQEKELQWRSLEVEAQLDADGRLHVRETQAIVFTGDWNGAQRIFRVAPGQRIAIHNVTRMGSSGEAIHLTRGDLDRVDHYDWHNSTTLRWRSRGADDPPFAETEITYVLDYTLSNILVPSDAAFLLDHDFAFAEREGPIERFTLDLELDPVWKPQTIGAFTGRYAKGPLPPGDSFVLRLPLTYAGTGRPAGVWYGAGPKLRTALGLVLILAVVFELLRFLFREQALGRYKRLTRAADINETWLSEHVFHQKPEVVGAAYDNTTSAPEVAAVIARLVAEGKIRSRVETRKVLFIRRDVLHLELNGERSELEDYERSLVNALFFDGRTTDTDRIRAHYRRQGFDPAKRIRAPIERMVKRLHGPGLRSPELSFTPSIVLALAGLAGMGAAAIQRPAETGPLIASLFVGAVMTIGIGVVAYRHRMSARAGAALLIFLVLLGAFAAGASSLIRGTAIRPSALCLVGFVLYIFGLCRILITIAKSRENPRSIAMRRDLASARQFFSSELRRPQPRLRDAWVPYLIALGLGPHLDRWFRAFGGATAGAPVTGGALGSSSSGTGGISGSTTWTGGGGAFGGAGATGSWAAAVGTMASGVPSPSSSSSAGGGGGGGSSSGGGGGGGW